MKILVVDDDSVNLNVVMKLLREQGHEPVGAADGQAALQMFRHDEFPVIITDWVMPLMDGLDLCRTIRALCRESYTYVILLTCLEGKDRYMEAIAAGVDDFLPKPLDPDGLVARLNVSERILGLQGRMGKLEGLLAICAYCKKIRSDSGRWIDVDRYMYGRTDLSFSHGICMACDQTIKSKLNKGVVKTLLPTAPVMAAPPETQNARGTTDQGPIEGCFTAATTSFEAGPGEGAVEILKNLLGKERPDRTSLEAYLAAVLLDLGRLDLARTVIEQIEGQQVADETLYVLAEKCEQRHLRTHALELFRKLWTQNETYRDVAQRVAALSDSGDVSLEQQLIGYLPHRYQHCTVAGRSEFCTVIKAYDKEMARSVAIKFLQPALKQHESHEELFFREARVLGRLHHAGIPQYYHLETFATPYIVMEFLEGMSILAQSQRKALILKEALTVLRRTVEILEYCHRHGIIHGDIQPKNIFVSTHNDVKLVNFRLAQDGDKLLRTPIDVAAGDPLFQSPEALQGETVDFRSDMYSLGVCLYAVCCGQLPFKLDADRREVEPRAPSHLNPRLPRPLERLILKCLESKAQNRYQDYRELLREFAPFAPES
jgi:CheY-like chemotaxis protein